MGRGGQRSRRQVALREAPVANMQPVIVVGAGPVGLCLTLALAQAGIPVTIIEMMSDQSFLDQVPRAGSNHPSTLEFFDKIGLYQLLQPRGIIAPRFHYLDPQGRPLIVDCGPLP